jgi:hypothetical protein
LRLPADIGGARNADPAGSALEGRFGLSEEALSRLEAGLRAQRHQLGTEPAQPIQRPPLGEIARQESNAQPSPEQSRLANFRRLPGLLLVIVPIVIAGLAGYHLVTGQVAPVPQEGPVLEPVSERIEPAPIPIPTPPPAVEMGREQSNQSNTSPTLPPPKAEAESQPAVPVQPEVSTQIIAPASIPARALPSPDATPQRPHRSRKTRPVQQPKSVGAR